LIGTTGAAILFIVNICFASALGVGAGALICLLLRCRWDLKTAVIDAVIAAGVAVIAAYVVAAIEIARGVWESRVTLILAIAVGSVVLRHVLRPLLRSSLR
jgi:hypothetical protein